MTDLLVTLVVPNEFTIATIYLVLGPPLLLSNGLRPIGFLVLIRNCSAPYICTVTSYR
jgi:hypothetical protein